MQTDRPIYPQFSDDGQGIRKWSFEPFAGGRRFDPQPMVEAEEWMREPSAR